MKAFLKMAFGLLLTLSLAGYVHAQQNVGVPELPGRIALVGIDGNVYVLSSHDNHPVSVTDDATQVRQYSWPTWSNDGRLAYFTTTVGESGLETDIFISKDGQAKGDLAYAAIDEAFTYAYWSPGSCSQTESCRDLAVLFSNPSEQLFSVRLVRSNGESSNNSLVGKGAPFYYSWSPDGARMLLLRNAQRLDIYDAIDNKLSETLPQTPGNFQAPAWSPVDNRWLLGVLEDDQQSTDLVTVTDNKTQTLASQLTGPITFAWSPDGNYVAYSDNHGPLVVVNSQTGDKVTRSPVTGVFAFFWSPDSQHIAYITLAGVPGSINASSGGSVKVAAQNQNPPGIAWSVLDVGTGQTRLYGSFYPTNEMIYLLTFFDQFGQSHHVWSPDSHYLIYGELKGANFDKPTISILDTTRADTVPFSVADGVIGVWSFN